MLYVMVFVFCPLAMSTQYNKWLSLTVDNQSQDVCAMRFEQIYSTTSISAQDQPPNLHYKYFRHVLSSHVLIPPLHRGSEADPNQHSWSKWRQGGPTYS